jgi:hypothetical protein
MWARAVRGAVAAARTRGLATARAERRARPPGSVVRLIGAEDPRRAVAAVLPGAEFALGAWLADVCTAGPYGPLRAREAVEFIGPGGAPFIEELAVMLEHFAGARDGRALFPRGADAHGHHRCPAPALAMWTNADERGVSVLRVCVSDYPCLPRTGSPVVQIEPAAKN